MVLRPFLAPRFDLSLQFCAAARELPRGHIPALDAIRGLAIVLVTLYRLGGGGDGPAQATSGQGLMELGARGVDLFFVLSGFLITGILFDAKGKAHYFRDFYARRALRILPLYYAALFGTLILLPWLASGLASPFQPAIDRQGWLWLYGPNVVQAVEGRWCLGPLNHFWSLAIEEHFYLLWPVVIYFASRQSAMRVCAGVITASVLARLTWLMAGGNNVAAEVLTPLRMDSLVLGSWVALVARGPGGMPWLVSWARPTLLVVGAAALAAEFLDRRLFGLPHVLWGLTFAALLTLTVAAGRDTWLGRCGQSSLLQFFGKYSYAMYVFQLPLIYLLAPVVTAGGLAGAFGLAWLGQLVYCGLLFALTTAAACLSWHCFEKHVLALKRCFAG